MKYLLLAALFIMPSMALVVAQDIYLIEAPRAASAQELIEASKYENRTPGIALTEGILQGFHQAQIMAPTRAIQVEQARSIHMQNLVLEDELRKRGIEIPASQTQTKQVPEVSPEELERRDKWLKDNPDSGQGMN